MTEKENNLPEIISVTGTKGKTTIVKLLETVYIRMGRETLLVDTHGHYLNGEKRGTSKESVNTYGLIPTVCPGRFLHEIKNRDNPLAILETSIGSSGPAGLGYKSHDIGILTNVFEDHIGRRIKTKEALAKKKGYIFRRVKTDGVLIFNADDPYVVPRVTRSRKIVRRKNAELLPVGIDFSAFKLSRHLENGGEALTRKGKYLVLLSSDGERKLMNLSSVEWTFFGEYEPAVLNLMMAVACVYKESKGFPDVAKKALEEYQPKEEESGRLLCYRNERKNISVVVDHAHEKNSIMSLGKLAEKISGRKTIGVLCFNPDRTDEQLKDCAYHISNTFNTTIVYDKIDGVDRKPDKDRRKVYYRGIGEVSNIVYNEMRSYTEEPNRLFKELAEEDAIKKALEVAKEGDLIIHIFGNEGLKSLDMLKRIVDVQACSCKDIMREVTDKRKKS